MKDITEMMKDPNTAKQAWKETYFFGSFRPNTARMNVLSAGTNGMSQKISVILSFHQVDIFGFDSFLLPENQENNCQPHGSLCSRHCNDEKDDDLSVNRIG